MKYGDITVIIPVKERLNLLKSALISINNQSLIPKHVLIIDDASSEKISINRKYNFKYKLIRNKKKILEFQNREIKVSNYVKQNLCVLLIPMTYGKKINLGCNIIWLKKIN